MVKASHVLDFELGARPIGNDVDNADLWITFPDHSNHENGN